MTEDDLIAFASVPSFGTPLLRYEPGVLRFFVFLVVVVILPVVALVTGSREWWHDPTVRRGALVVIALSLAALFLLERPAVNFVRRLRIRWGGYAEHLQTRRIELSIAGIRSITRTAEIATSWDEIETVGVSAAGLYLASDATHAYLVPRRAFADETAFVDFVQAARRFKAEQSSSRVGPADKMDP